MKLSLGLLLAGLFLFCPIVFAARNSGGQQNNQSPTASAKDSADLQDLLRSAGALYQEGRIDEAQAGFKKIVELYPDSARARFGLGFTYYKQNKYRSASESFAIGLHLDPIAVVYLFKSELDRVRGATEEALADCREAIKLDPNSVQAYLLMANIQQILAKYSDAAESLKRLTELEPNNPERFVALGNLLTSERLHADSDKVVAAFEKAMELDPKHQAGRFDLGRYFVEQGRLAEARKLWEGRASDEDNIFPNFIVELQRAERVAAAKKGLEKSPNDPAVLTEYGLAVVDGDSWVMDGRHERAVIFFERAVKLDPKNVKAHYGLAVCYTRMQTLADETKTNDLKQKVAREQAIVRSLDAKLAVKLDAELKDEGLPGGVPGGELGGSSVDR